MSKEPLHECPPAAFEFEGHTHLACGTIINEANVIGAYVGPADDGHKEHIGTTGPIEDSDGRRIGHYIVTGVWRVHSYVATTRCALRVVIDGRTYHGRSWGCGMLFNGTRDGHELKEWLVERHIKELNQ